MQQNDLRFLSGRGKERGKTREEEQRKGEEWRRGEEEGEEGGGGGEMKRKRERGEGSLNNIIRVCILCLDNLVPRPHTCMFVGCLVWSGDNKVCLVHTMYSKKHLESVYMCS